MTRLSKKIMKRKTKVAYLPILILKKISVYYVYDHKFQKPENLINNMKVKKPTIFIM